MGCDIHTTLWQTIQFRGYEVEFGSVLTDALIERDYFFFALLAGVRNNWDLVPIAEPRGFPKLFNGGDHDLEKEREPYDYGGAIGGDHTPSWLTIEELRKVADRYEKEAPKNWDTYLVVKNKVMAIRAVCDYADAYAERGPCFFVFSFDN